MQQGHVKGRNFNVRDETETVDGETVVHTTPEEQKLNGWPGLAKEVSERCKEIGIADVNNTEVSKDTVKEEIFYHHYRELKTEMEEREMLSDVCHEDFKEVQQYMKNNSVEQARMKFSLRAKMYNCRANLHGKYDEEDRGCPAFTQAEASEGGGV